jgi:sec-independent protein translocase protein TatA
MGGLSIWHWIIVIGVVLLLFGRGKISELMGDVAQGIKAFKKGMSEDDTTKSVPEQPAAGQKTIDHHPADVSLKARAQTEEKAEGSNV